MKRKPTTMAVALFLIAAWLTVPAGRAEAKTAHVCSTGGLNATNEVRHQDGADLDIKGVDCLVGAGTFKLGNVHIRDGGTLTFADANIDFWAKNILVEKGGSLLAGVDKNGTVNPIANGVITIHLYGADLVGTDPDKRNNGITCLTDERCGVPQDIWESNLDSSHKPVDPSGARKVSALASASAYLGVKDDYFYPYHPLTFDDSYFGSKVLGVAYGGTLRLFGKKGACVTGCDNARTTGQSWVRLAKTIGPSVADAKTLIVDAPVDWKKGDEIVVTTTDYLPGHSEVLTLAADANGTTITVNEQVKYVHNGSAYEIPADAVSKLGLAFDHAETRAAVALLTRNIRIVSAGDTKDQDFPSAETGYFFGGHLIALQGFKVFQVQGVEFKQMGQGGRIGHYPVHFHHARKTPADTFVKDSSVNESMTRWITLHGTQDVTLARNVGYKSIGHGFYLEDGTEINNKLFANLGIFARAAVDNPQNPRKVPGILAAPNQAGFAPTSDYTSPTVFWIMNGWNDFEGNMAAGAGTCGACYWLLGGVNSGLSRGLKWESYASIQDYAQDGRGGMSPLKSFVANFCTSAMTSFQTVGKGPDCLGVGGGAPNLSPVANPLAQSLFGDEFPKINELRHPTRCGGKDHDPHADCSSAPPICGAGQLGECMVTVLDRYTTSFNWAPFNTAAIWLRPQWYLVSNSVITDVQQAGLTFVTGGGYTAADVVPGHWALVEKSVFIGHTQEDNPYASNGGPFNPKGLSCAVDSGGRRPANYCLSIDEGVSLSVDNFGMYQRLFSIYDGPAFQDSNAYLNIKRREIDDCTYAEHNRVFDGKAQDGFCAAGPNDKQSAWLAGIVVGLPKANDPVTKTDFCYMPNAAIGWKQPNGFYYPPALHSKNLFFKDVDTRHFVITPLPIDLTNDTVMKPVKDAYCAWGESMFSSFTDIDRQTVLNDDDGTLTGYKNTTVVNLDDFFHAPVQAIECRSDRTSTTSPYQYLTTVIYPKCLTGQGETCSKWETNCANNGCSGVPLYRQDLLPLSDKNVAKGIRMMGQDTGQRSSLTVNNGTYYVDTAVDGSNNQFEANHTYYLFLIYATEDSQQTYRFYVGENTNFDPATIQMVQANIEPNPTSFTNLQSLPRGSSRAQWLGGNKDTAKGVVEVRLRVKDFPDVAAKYKTARQNKCQPASYCTWKADTGTCVDATGSDTVCRWGGAHPECPDGGCIGIAFTLPAGFTTLEKPETVRPPAACVAQNFTDEDGKKVWDVSLQPLTPPDGVCPKPADTLTPDFCK